MHKHNFKVFARVRAKGTNLNYGCDGYGWGCIQANTAYILFFHIDFLKNLARKNKKVLCSEYSSKYVSM